MKVSHESMPEIIELIERLIENGNASVAEGMLFQWKPTDYGSLSRRKLEEQVDGARDILLQVIKKPQVILYYGSHPVHQIHFGTVLGVRGVRMAH